MHYYYMMKSPATQEMPIDLYSFVTFFREWLVGLYNCCCCFWQKEIISALLLHWIADGPAASGESGSGGEQRKQKMRLPNNSSTNRTTSTFRFYWYWILSCGLSSLKRRTSRPNWPDWHNVERFVSSLKAISILSCFFSLQFFRCQKSCDETEIG